MNKQADILTEFLDKKTIDSLSSFLDKEKGYESSADAIAIAFGSGKGFSKMKEDAVEKLVSSFKNNLTLLIQKTWVEKSDIALKDQLLYQLGRYIYILDALDDFPRDNADGSYNPLKYRFSKNPHKISKFLLYN